MNQANSGGQNLQNQGQVSEVYQAETININKT
jgi:hypothetical protein